MVRFYYPEDSRPQDSIRENKFTCGELIEIFGGWFTLQYAFTSKKEGDYYLVTKELSQTPREDWPPLNAYVSKMMKKDIYGLAILCPENLVR